MRRSRKLIFSVLFGMIAAFCLVAGLKLDTMDYLDLLALSFYQQLLPAAVLCSAVVYGLWTLMNRGGAFALKNARAGTPGKETLAYCGGGAQAHLEHVGADRIPRLPYAANVGIMLLCWLPALLSIFPGAFPMTLPTSGGWWLRAR